MRLLLPILFFLPVFVSWSSYANTPLVSSPRFFTLSTTNGLSQDSVTDMLLDKDGFLYVGTAGGLDRWDGHQLKRIIGSDNQLLDTSIYRVFQDSKGFIWISTDYNGVYRLNPKHNSLEAIAQFPYPGDETFIQSASAFVEDSEGNIYISLEQRLVVFDYQDDTLNTVYELPADLIDNEAFVRWGLPVGDFAIVATTKGLFAKTNDGEVIELLYLPENDTHEDSSNVKHLLVDSSNRFWIATVRGLYVTTVEDLTSAVESGNGLLKNVKNALSEKNIWRIVEESKDNFWVGTDIGLVNLDASQDYSAKHILEPMKGIDVLSKKDITDIEVDRDGNLWLGTNYGGALYWSPRSLNFSTLKNQSNQTNPALTDNTIWAILEDTDNNLWLGTDNGLTKYDPITKTSELFFKSEVYIPYSDTYIDRIFEIDENSLILQSAYGLWQFDKNTGQRKIVETQSPESQSIVSGWLYGSGIDAQKRIWFTSEGEMYIYNPVTKSLEKATLDTQINPTFFNSFLNSSPYYENRMWASVIGQLWLVSPDTFEAELVHQLPAELLTRELYPSSVVRDSLGILWITYPGQGLYGLDAETFEPIHFFNTDNILLSNLVYGLKLDDDDNLWFSSHSGIHQLEANRKDVNNYHYGLELNVAEFNEAAVERLSNGSFAYGSPTGIVFFDPKQVNKIIDSEASSIVGSTSVDQMVISEVSLANRELNLPLKNLNQEAIVLDHLDNGLTIRFSSLQFANRGTTRYEYSLYKNNSLLSSAIVREPLVSFPLLEAGDYRFVVESTALDAAIMRPAEIKIRVNHAPWKSPQAQAFYVLVSILLLLTVWWIRQSQRSNLELARSQLRLFGDAFKQTRDWVVIFSYDFQPVAVNPAFEHAFGLNSAIALDAHFEDLQQRYPELWRVTQAALRKIKVGDFWRNERQLQLADGKNHDVLLDLSAVSDDKYPQEITHYLLVLSDISEQKQAERKLLKLATYDNLTGLVNRSLLLDRLEHAIANAKQHDALIAVLFVDLDRFKGINDSLGHDYGDNLLRVVAKRMQSLASQNDTVARMGGDEFVIVREEVDNLDSVGTFIAQLVESIEEPISINSETLRVSCSVGVSIFPSDADKPDELLRYADVAMYSAKGDSLNSFKFFTEEMNVRAKQRLSVENLVKKAYQNELFFNVYQPIVNIHTNQTEGMELLLRCAISEQPLSPADFIPILEEMRLIVEVTRKSVIAGIKHLAQWYESGYRGYLSVNLSALHFSASFDLKILARLLQHHNLPKSALRFEVTESILMSDKDTALKQFNALREEGYLLALDDFGTGYSSLSYLKMFPLDVLKIDKSFTDDIGTSKSDESLIITTIGMAKNLEMDCIAEGIETLEQVKFLQQQDCFRLQGYYFSKPVTEDFAKTVVLKNWDPIE